MNDMKSSSHALLKDALSALQLHISNEAENTFFKALPWKQLALMHIFKCQVSRD